MTIKQTYKRLGDGQRYMTICQRTETSRIGPMVSCPGKHICPYGLVNTEELTAAFDERFVGSELPAKTKFAVSGCANACTKPQQHDVGFMGVAELRIDHENCVTCQACVKHCPAMVMTIINGVLSINSDKCLSCGYCIRVCPKKALQTRFGYRIYIGGRFPHNGKRIAAFITEDKAIPYMEAIIATYQEIAGKGQRLKAVIAKLGIAVIKAKIENKLNAGL